jgi:serine/threonine protein kinase
MGVPESQSLKAPPLGTVLGERYRLVRFLGHGAIGAVYEVATPSDQRLALKVLLEIQQQKLADEMAQRFVREAQLASTLDSEHIVPVVDSGMDGALRIPYLVMPLLSGLDLESLLAEVGALHPTVAVRIVMQACVGAAVAHKAKVVHRDIKPGNLYLQHGPDGTVVTRVLDFGLAKMAASDQSITAAGSIMGTPHYMSPEQSKNAKDVDERADVWGMSATLYHALAGCAPFDEERRFSDLHLAINTRDPMPIQERAPWIDPALARVVHGGLLRDRALRCPSIRELAQALEPFTAGSNALNAMMLEPAPAVLRTLRAPRSGRVELWEPSAPSSQMPPVSDEPIDPLLGHKLGDRYALLRILGRRAANRLYEAIAPDANRFAVRVIDPTGEDRATAARRVVREAKALLSIQSPHVVQLLDAAFDEALGVPFVVMELMHGVDLGRLIDKHGPLDPRVAVPLLVQACRGLDAAHARGIVHRDVRPGNLFVEERPGGELAVRLTGFSLVRRTLKSGEQTYGVTRATEVVGSTFHMSPEQARNPTNVDHRTDIWSLGACLYHVLAGVPPWPTTLYGGELLFHIGSESPAHLQDRAPWVQRPLAAVVHRAMHRDPSARFQSAMEMAQALEPLSLMTTITMLDLGPLPNSMRGRIEDRAPHPDHKEPSIEPSPLAQRAPYHAPQPNYPANYPSPPSESTIPPALARRRAAERATFLFAVGVGLLMLVAIGGYIAWTLVR